MKYILLILCLSALSVSCAKKSDSELSYVTVTSSGDPVLLNENSRSQRSLRTLSGEETYINDYLFRGSSKCISSDLISNIQLSGSYKWILAGSAFKEEELVASKDFSNSICDEYSEIGTYDHAATSILSALVNTQNLLSQTQLRPSKVKLRVAPLIAMETQTRSRTTVYTKETYMVNNAFYNPYAKEITFLPQGRDLRGVIPFSSVPLWNIPFVASHEYGHHIFNEILGNSVNLTGHTCFDQPQDNVAASSAVATNEKLISAINEAFADLIGKMSSDKDFSFKGVDCFEHTRDVDNNAFYDGTTKSLTSYFWSEFVSPTPMRIYTCNQTNYSEIHHFGAVIAHGLYSTMKIHGGYNISVVIDWLKNYKEVYSISNGLKENLRLSLVSFDKALKSNIAANNLNTCDTLSSKFPVFDKQEVCSE